MAGTGIFARLRRRRWALSLAFGYALFLNALLGSISAAETILPPGPLALIGAALCGEADGGDRAPAPYQHQRQTECPLCGSACPMGGCPPTPALGGTVAALAAPTGAAGIQNIDGHPVAGEFPRSLYLSDLRSQAPPATA